MISCKQGENKISMGQTTPKKFTKNLGNFPGQLKHLCRKCGVEKSGAEFEGTSKVCSSCASAATDQTQSLSRDRKYGLSPGEYDQMLEEQQWACAICRRPHKKRPSRKWGRAQLAVDHDHRTGKVRGLLCNPCNTALGFLNDSVAVLRLAAEYLEKAAAA